MLNHKVSVYIPSTISGNKPAPAELIEKWERATKELLARQFGGFTRIPTSGGWWSNEHGLIEEQITIIQSYTDVQGLEKTDKVIELAKQMASDMGQEAVSVEIDSTLRLVAA